MINDLDKTLEELLKKELPHDLVQQVAISFAIPDNQFPPSSVNPPAIDLFLYDVRENRGLRSNEWVMKRENGNASHTPPPVRIDCSYLITTWASENAPHDEHQLLGEVMKVLLRHPTIPEKFLQGELEEEELPIPTASLQAGQLQSPGEFWQALGGKPKASLHYTVTISVQPHETEPLGPLVTDKRLRFQQFNMESS